MELRLHSDLAEFAALTEAFYGADPVTHTVALTVTAQRLTGEAPPSDVRALLTLYDGDSLVGAALRTGDYPMAVSGLPAEAAASAVDVLTDHDPELFGVIGPRPRAEAFATAWCAAHGTTARTAVAHRLFRLGELTPPTGVPGEARRAGPTDLEVVARWLRAFTEEAAPKDPVPGPDAAVRQLSGRGGTLLWEVDGEPVAMARASAPTWAMSRIGAVYTPAEHRGHGYGSAVTAATSVWAQTAGAGEVVLFTDLANPVSNAIYPRLGFRPVHDSVQLRWD
jgi:GNAT superfamily N-acetyltransferase